MDELHEVMATTAAVSRSIAQAMGRWSFVETTKFSVCIVQTLNDDLPCLTYIWSRRARPYFGKKNAID